MKIIFILFLIILSGCASPITELRRDGFDMTSRSFDLIESNSAFSRSYNVNLRVTIVSDRSMFAHIPFRNQSRYVAGYYDGGVWVIGKMVNGRIIVNQCVLGHEVQHALQHQSSEVADPDKLDACGL